MTHVNERESHALRTGHRDDGQLMVVLNHRDYNLDDLEDAVTAQSRTLDRLATSQPEYGATHLRDCNRGLVVL
jgi:hypothetical protein